ncbi:cobyric acid synthase CobQ [Halonotius aquaticus]|uniref:Probable cobyric acid synthase n=1 Tax=Halonotius aquaticus TaxID=2216978 RepID=A0A3A6PX06_9EURY|nr:cobyric acid synthase [Halonotius aquaticus]RJX44244.1 cobyric acid synthase CobQ [Halonotius aquaticus]
MAHTILVAGTASHVGKSTVATGLCRLLADRGISVAPFKAQNMSNNARAVPRAPETMDKDGNGDGDAYGEIGVSQYVQARAAHVSPTTDCNPVLLKPRGEGESQLVVDGVAVGHYAAGDYYDDHWETARAAAVAAHDRLAAAHDVIVAEGAGSIAEINFHDRDLANVETARFADADIVLVGDIERGGVFASLVGTLELMPDDLRDQVIGVVITKFRGDADLLAPGVDAFEERTGVDVLGVIPYDDPGLPAEDSVDLPATDERAVRGDADGVDAEQSVTIAVPRLPRVSNFTDLEPLAAEPGVRIAYVPLDASLADADAVVIPGTKNTVDDLLAIREAGFDDELRAFDGPIVGLCGGYQLLGERLRGVDTEASSAAATELASTTLPAVGLLPVETTFTPEKRVVDTTFELDGAGPLAGASGSVSGYEIHMGTTEATAAVERPFARDGDASAALGASAGDVLGCYLHGLFETGTARDAFVERVFEAAGRERPTGATPEPSPYARAAALVADNCSLDFLDLD